MPISCFIYFVQALSLLVDTKSIELFTTSLILILSPYNYLHTHTWRTT